MILGRVKGEVVSTIKHPAYANRRVLLLDRIGPDGQELGGYLVAIEGTASDRDGRAAALKVETSRKGVRLLNASR